MRVLINGKFSYFLTFSYHWIILSFIWTGLENFLYGYTVPSLEDSVIQIIVITYLTIILGRESNS